MSAAAIRAIRAARPPRRRRRLEAGITLTPMLDVIFNLIFFFVLTTTIRQEMTQLPVRLPEAASSQAAAATATPTLVLDAEGRLYFDDRYVADSELELLLRDLAAGGGTEIRLRGDKEAQWERVVRVMDICRKVGMGLLADTLPSGSGARGVPRAP